MIVIMTIMLTTAIWKKGGGKGDKGRKKKKRFELSGLRIPRALAAPHRTSTDSPVPLTLQSASLNVREVINNLVYSAYIDQILYSTSLTLTMTTK